MKTNDGSSLFIFFRDSPIHLYIIKHDTRYLARSIKALGCVLRDGITVNVAEGRKRKHKFSFL